jgi:hypothetical protein
MPKRTISFSFAGAQARMELLQARYRTDRKLPEGRTEAQPNHSAMHLHILMSYLLRIPLINQVRKLLKEHINP